MNKSVIIIGGGIGGLCTGCLLSKEGYTVTVLEKHYKIGGSLHTFRKNGSEFETGMHYISGFQEGGVLRRIFSYLRIYDSLQIKPLDTEAFDIIHVKEDNHCYPIGIGKEKFIKHWVDFFPDERENIQAYTNAIYEIADRFPLCNLRVSDDKTYELFGDESVVMPVGSFIARYITNPKLQKLLAWNNPLYAGDAQHTPVYVHAIINHLFIEGAARFVNGSQQLADLMCKMIEQYGGQVICSDGVKKIIAKDRHVEYVLTEKGEKHKADLYISSIHPANMITLLDDTTQFTKAYRTRLETMQNTYSAFIVFLKMKPESFPYFNQNQYFVENYDEIWRVGQYTTDEWPIGMMMMTAPKSLQNEKWAETIIVSCLMRYDDVRRWDSSKQGQRPPEYVAFKQKCENRVLDKLKYYYPDLENCIESQFSATPLTVRDFTGSKEGSLYGYFKDCQHLECAQLSPATKISNLFLTGQNINLHGILGTPLNAIITVGAVTGKYNELIQKISSH